MRLVKLLIPFLSLLTACGSNARTDIFSLAYRDENKVVVTNTDTTKQLSFADATNPAISPDGLKLAYTMSDSSGHRSIWVAELDSERRTKLPVAFDNSFQAVWSPTGKRIAFSVFTDEGRWKVGVIDSNYTNYVTLDSLSASDVYSPTWKNEEELVAHDLVNLYTLNLAGEVVEKQLLTELIGNDLSVSSSNRFFFTKDNQKLVFNAGNSDDVENPVGPNEAVYVVDLKTKKLSRISPEGLNAPYVFVNADDRIFFSASKVSDSIFQIYTADLSGSIELIGERGMSPTGSRK